jgi:hypothetical protein
MLSRAMADPVIHISEEEAARDFAGLMARVRAALSCDCMLLR